MIACFRSFASKKHHQDLRAASPNRAAFARSGHGSGSQSPNQITSSHGTGPRRIERGGERLWRFEDFRELPFSAVAQALSRLTREGTVERLSKGVYYRTRDTAFGKSRPNPAAIRSLVSRQKTLFPSGMAAASLLGFTTQMPRRSEIATSALSLPRKLVGEDTLVHTRRPGAWAELTETDAALLDILRNGAKLSGVEP